MRRVELLAADNIPVKKVQFCAAAKAKPQGVKDGVDGQRAATAAECAAARSGAPQ